MVAYLGGSWPLGAIFGIPVRIHTTFFALLAVQVLGSLAHGAAYCLLWFILMGPILLLTVALHELGHCLAARSVGSEVHGIMLWPLGGLAMIGQAHGPKVMGLLAVTCCFTPRPPSPLMPLLQPSPWPLVIATADIWVALAGPLTHVPMTALWTLILLPVWHATYGSYAVRLVMDVNHLGAAVVVGAIVLNISLFAFNLLVPAYPLDGGRILLDLLLCRGVADATAAKVVIGVALPIGLGVIAFGIWPSFQMVTIMVGIFILFSTFQLFQAVRMGTISQHPMFCGEEQAAAHNTTTVGAGQGKGGQTEGAYHSFGEQRV